MAESSKQANKRAKIDKLYVQDVLVNDSNDEGSSNDLPDAAFQVEKSQKSKNKRGPTLCKSMSTGSVKKVEVEFNERGQPIGEGSVKLSSYMGAMVRKMVPITYDDWRRVPQQTKDNLWLLVQKKFILNEGQQKQYVLQDMARLLRSYRSTLTSQISKYRKQGKDLAILKPKDIDSAQWETFVKQRSSGQFMERSNKFKQIRANQVLSHTCSRKGYARLEDEMKKVSPNPSSISRVNVWQRAHSKKDGEVSNPIVVEQLRKIQEIGATQSSFSLKDDEISHILGSECHGRARGVGFRVIPSKLSAIEKSTAMVVQLEGKIASLEEQLQDMAAQMKQMQQMATMQQQKQEILMNKQGQGVVNKQMLETTIHVTSHSQDGSNKLKRGDKCKLIQWCEPHIEVAKATWVTDNPSTMVHNVQLGPKDSKVIVKEAIEPLAPLWRPTSDDVDDPTIQDVLGTFIAWPTLFIISDLGD